MAANGKWSDDYYVRAYELAKSGMSNKRIANTLGVSGNSFDGWLTKYPALRKGIAKARRQISDAATASETFQDYVYERLPLELQMLWDEIDEADQAPDALTRIDALLAKQGKRTRQHLFLYALTSANFKISEAMRKLNLKRKEYENWRASDPGFVELMDEIMWHKKNFFEGALLDMVASGEPSAVIFVNKTQNKDRGYNEKVEVEVQGNIGVGPADATSAALLSLPVDVRRQVLAAIRAAKQPRIVEEARV